MQIHQCMEIGHMKCCYAGDSCNKSKWSSVLKTRNAVSKNITTYYRFNLLIDFSGDNYFSNSTIRVCQ